MLWGGDGGGAMIIDTGKLVKPYDVVGIRHWIDCKLRDGIRVFIGIRMVVIQLQKALSLLQEEVNIRNQIYSLIGSY